MIIPSATVVCSTMIVSLHSLAVTFKYNGVIAKRFQKQYDFDTTHHKYSVSDMLKSIKQELYALQFEYKYAYKRKYAKTLKKYYEFILTKHADEYPEYLI